MTRRISSLDETMQIGDYIRVLISVTKYDNEELGAVEAVLIKGTSNICWLLTNDGRLHGNPIECVTRNCYTPEMWGMEHSWASVDVYAEDTANEILFHRFDTLDITVHGVVIEGQCPTEDAPQVSRCSEFIAKGYEKTHLYTGQGCYHHGVVMNKPLKDNYEFRVGVELEVEFNDDYLRDDFNRKPSNWFYRESDGSLGSHGCEIITIPLLPKDAKSEKFWKPLVDDLRGNAQSWDTGRCGLHVHVGREAFGKNAEEQSETEGKLLYLYHHIVKDTAFNTKVYGRSHSYNEHEGKTDEGNAVALLGGEKLLRDKDICKKVGDAMKNRAEDTRYFDINTTNSATIEFRKGRGSINEARIAMVVEYCLLLVRFARRSPWSGISAMRWRDFVRFNAKSEALKQLINDWL